MRITAWHCGSNDIRQCMSYKVAVVNENLRCQRPSGALRYVCSETATERRREEEASRVEVPTRADPRKQMHRKASDNQVQPLCPPSKNFPTRFSYDTGGADCLGMIPFAS